MTQDNNQLIASLTAKLGNIDDRIKTLQERREAIKGTIQYLYSEGAESNERSFDSPVSEDRQDEISSSSQILPTEAVMEIFNKNPEKTLSPAHLRDELVELRKAGKLNSDSKNLLQSIHSILKTKVKSGEIQKINTGKEPVYQITKPKNVQPKALFDLNS